MSEQVWASNHTVRMTDEMLQDAIDTKRAIEQLAQRLCTDPEFAAKWHREQEAREDDLDEDIILRAGDRVETTDGRKGRVLNPDDIWRPFAIDGLTVSVSIDGDPGAFHYFPPEALTRITDAP